MKLDIMIKKIFGEQLILLIMLYLNIYNVILIKMNYKILLQVYGKVQYKEFNMNFKLSKIYQIYTFKYNQNKKQK